MTEENVIFKVRGHTFTHYYIRVLLFNYSSLANFYDATSYVIVVSDWNEYRSGDCTPSIDRRVLGSRPLKCST